MKITLHSLLERNLTLPPEYRDQLTNHLPMALHALHALGAGGERLHAFYASYAQRFEGLPATPAAYTQRQAVWSERLRRDGADAVLRAAVPLLLPGASGSAFHGLIRAGHAVQTGHAGELAAALAYWDWRQQLLPAAPAGPLMSFEEWSQALQAQSAGWQSSKPLISLRMAEATASPAYQALAGRLEPSADLLARLARFAAERYAITGNFTVLHMVTATRALRVLAPWIGDLQAATPLLAQAFAAAWLAARIDPQAQPRRSLAGGWDEVRAAAIASDDDHVVKLVHACDDHARSSGRDDPFLQAARVAVS
jgi:hypothetical protein